MEGEKTSSFDELGRFYHEFNENNNGLKWIEVSIKEAVSSNKTVLIIPISGMNPSNVDDKQNNDYIFILEEGDITPILEKCKKIPNIPKDIALGMHIFNSFTSRTFIILNPSGDSRVDVFVKNNDGTKLDKAIGESRGFVDRIL